MQPTKSDKEKSNEEVKLTEEDKEMEEIKELAKTSPYWKGKLAMIEGRYEEMKKSFLEAIELGDSSAMNDLAYYHQYAKDPADKDPEKVVHYYKMAIAAGNVNSCYNLGCFYHEKGDAENKLQFLTLASEKGDARAHFGLGMHYEHKDEEKSFKYYKLAADTGLAKAHTALGDYYAGLGNFHTAKQEYTIAIEGGDKSAAYRLSYIRHKFEGDERKEISRLVDKAFGFKAREPTSPRQVKQETKQFVTPEGEIISYVTFSIGKKSQINK